MSDKSMANRNRISRIGAGIVALLFAVPSLAQQPQTAANPTANPAPNSSPWPQGVTPPHVTAPYPCHFPRAAFDDNPTMPATVAFTVTVQGKVINPTIARSSGSANMDEAARECITQWAYAPALRDGVPVEMPWSTEISLTRVSRSGAYQLPNYSPPGTNVEMMPVEKYRATVSSINGCDYWHRNAPHGALVAFDVEPDGSVKNATLAATSGDTAVDNDAVTCVSRRIYKPATRNGEPVEVHLKTVVY
jgi:TonB family protein